MKEQVIYRVKYFMLLVVGLAVFLLIRDVPASDYGVLSARVVAERQNSDIRVVMYMTSW